MKWEKSSTGIIDTFEKIIPPIAGIEKRKMFGLPCAFVNSNMFMGAYGENIFIRLSKIDREVLLKLEGASVFEPRPGRIMKEYAVLPQWILRKENQDMMNDWIFKSFGYAASLPIKEKKAKS